MARPLKNGLNYFPLDVDFFDDPKVGAVAVEHGIKGQAAVVMLLCTIYRNGYYVEWTPENRVAILRQLPGITLTKMEKIVKTLVEWDFFDRTLFQEQQVLTSRDIQQNYLIAARRRKHANDDPLPFWLPDGEDTPETIHATAETVPQTTETTAKTKVKTIKTTKGSVAATAFPQTETEEMTAETTQEESIEIIENYQDSPSSPTPTHARETVSTSAKQPCGATQTAQPQQPQRGATTFPTPLPTNEAVEQMKNSTTWKESVCMRHHLSISQVDHHLDEFGLDCECRGKSTHESLSDAQSHFCNWLLVAQKKATRPQDNPSLTPFNPNNHATRQPQHTSAYFIEEAKQWAIEQTLRTIRTPSRGSQEVQIPLPF